MMASLTTNDMVPATPQTSAALGLPSFWSSSTGEPPLLDLSFLTEEEREKIESVLQADQELQTRDRIRLGTLRQEIEQDRSHQKAVASTTPPKCSYCERRLGRFFNTGADCPRCGYRVCKQCRKIPFVQPPKFVCTVCSKQKLLDLQSSAPRLSRNNSPTPERAIINQNEEEAKPPPLYGSTLVLMSLEAVGHRSCSSSPLPIAHPPHIALTNSSSVSSSIVVRYERHGSTESSPSPIAPHNRSSEARRVSAKELLASDDEDEEEPIDLTKTSNVPVMDYLKRSDSISSLGSVTSLYSAAGGKGDYGITGEVYIGVWFKDEQLFVKVVKARGLAAAKKGTTSDPYIKTYLLPDRTKYTKRKTSIQRKTLTPVFNEILKTKLHRNEIGTRTLWLSVWDWDRFGRNQFLGEIRLPLSSLDLTDPMERWYTLQDKEDGVGEDDFYRGKLRLGLKVEPSVNSKGNTRKGVASLLLKIHQAHELPKMNTMGLTDSTVKCYLLPNRSSGGKRKTRVVKNNLNPVWEEEFKYDFLTISELSTERVLEVTVWDFDRRGSNDFIGGLRLGPAPGRAAKHKEWMDSIGDEVTHWEEALARPGEWVEFWHTLRPSMNPILKQLSPASIRKTGLSPVKESPIGELEMEQSTPAVISGTAFTPPITPEHQPPTHSKPHAITSAQLNMTVDESTRTSLSPSPPPTSTATPSQATPSQAALISSQEATPPVTASQKHRSPSPIPELIVTESSLRKEDYHGSQTSLNSMMGGKGDYDISGEVLFGVHYKAGQLQIHVNKARGLAAADSNGLSDPYVKTYLLPDKSKTSKKKTAVKKRTLDPVYNETLKYKLDSTEIHSHTLWLSVWDWDRFGRNQFLGEVRLHLSSLNLTDGTDHWYSLQDKNDSHPLLPQPLLSTNNQPPVPLEQPPATEEPIHVHSNDISPLILSTSLASEATQLLEESVQSRGEKPDSSPVVSEPNKRTTAPSEPAAQAILLSDVGGLNSVNMEEEEEESEQTSGLKSAESVVSQDSHITLQETTPPPTASQPSQIVTESSLRKEDYHGSQTSLNSMMGGKGDYDISGEVLFGVHYKAGQLQIHVNKARGLAAADSNGLSDPYIKTYLLPDKSKTSKKKTAIKKRTLDPVYNETLKYKLDSTEIHSHTLWLSVWDWDRLGRNQFLGEVRLPLSSLDLTDGTDHWYTLQDKNDSHPLLPQPLLSTHTQPPAPLEQPPATEEPIPAHSNVSPQISSTSLAPEATQLLEESVHSHGEKPDSSPVVSEPNKRTTAPSEPAAQAILLSDVGGLNSVNMEEEEEESEQTSGLKSAESVVSQDSHITLQETTPPPTASQPSQIVTESSLRKEDYHGSQTSLNSMMGGKGDYDISGEVLFGVHYKAGQLQIHVNKARGLAAADSNGLSDPYVKTYLLPDKGKTSKKKTAVKKRTLDPVYKETLKYKLDSTEIHAHTLWLSVWDWDRFGRNQFLGEVRLPLSSLDLTDGTDHWYTLQDKDEQLSVDPSVHHKPSPSPSLQLESTLTHEQFSKPQTEQTGAREISQDEPVPSTTPSKDTLPLKSLTTIVMEPEQSAQSQPDLTPVVSEPDHKTTSEPMAHSTPLINIGDLGTADDEQEDHPKPKALTALQRGGLLGLKHTDSLASFGSQASVYSAAGGKGDYDISGEMLFGVHYKAGQLLIHVNKARGLAAANSNGLSDPYVKTYLLPDKSKTSKKKTAIKKRTLDPVYNETLKYKLNSTEIHSHTLWLSVWDWDRFGRNQFLGEVRLPLSSLDLTDGTDHWYTLQDKDEGGEGASYHGQLQLSLMFSPSEKQSKSNKTKGMLNLAIRQAKDLPQMHSSGTTDAFVKCYLLPDKSSSGKRKTGVIKNNLHPVWGTTFTYEKVSLEELTTERVLEIVLWDFNKGGSSDFIGGLRLGPAPGRAAKHKEWMDSIGDEVTHWEETLARPGEWVEFWHTLRTNMDYRSVSLT